MNTVIFDMDGLLIDSEPLWQEAADEIFNKIGISITTQQYETSTGLRTSEFLDYWFTYFNIDKKNIVELENEIVESVIDKVKIKGVMFSGVDYIFKFFKNQNFKIGLASSSPLSLINTVVEIANIEKYLNAVSSAQYLEYGKPHPQVFLDCAKELNSAPNQCICFEDSINGMIAVKSAKMKCVVVPAHHQSKDLRWSIADIKLTSLQDFNELHLKNILDKK